MYMGEIYIITKKEGLCMMPNYQNIDKKHCKKYDVQQS